MKNSYANMGNQLGERIHPTLKKVQEQLQAQVPPVEPTLPRKKQNSSLLEAMRTSVEILLTGVQLFFARLFNQIKSFFAGLFSKAPQQQSQTKASPIDNLKQLTVNGLTDAAAEYINDHQEVIQKTQDQIFDSVKVAASNYIENNPEKIQSFVKEQARTVLPAALSGVKDACVEKGKSAMKSVRGFFKNMFGKSSTDYVAKPQTSQTHSVEAQSTVTAPVAGTSTVTPEPTLEVSGPKPG